jgi:hypothetical protein
MNNRKGEQSQNGHDSRNKLDLIDIVFRGKFPKGYKNNVAHWGNIPKNKLHQTDKNGVPKLLHLDIDFGNSCSLRCPHCFQKDERLSSVSNAGFLKETDIIRYISEAREIGLETVKFLGRGEPFENRRFLGFLEKISDMGIKSSIFTKGHVIGSDDLAKKYNSNYGIETGQELVNRLKGLDVSILLGFNSFNRNIQEKYVCSNKSSIKNYVDLRDEAISRLVKAGFNKYYNGKETRLALILAPIRPENMNEIFDIYKWGRLRNIYTLSCPFTSSGPSNTIRKYIGDNNTRKYKNYISNLIILYSRIYKWNIERGMTTIPRFIEEGVSLYPGCHPCTQVAAGMYVTLSGKVVRCPGRTDSKSTFSEDVRNQNIKDVWLKSENHKRAQNLIKSPEGNNFNYHCPARDWIGNDGKTILPNDFYDRIKERTLSYFK